MANLQGTSDNLMTNIRSLILLLLLFSACSADRHDKKEILVAEFVDKGFGTTKCLFTGYSDSTYVFTVDEIEKYRHEKHEIFRGRYIQTGDSVVFFPFEFDYVSAETAVIKNNYLEFVDGKVPFKMKIVKAERNAYHGIDTIKFRSYSLFTYHPSSYRRFKNEVTAYDLTNEDLAKIEGILRLCIKEAGLNVDLKEYFKQCIAVRNENNEREVWVNLLCAPRNVEEVRYSVIYTNDGGDCYFNLMINLDKEQYYDLRVNGHA